MFSAPKLFWEIERDASNRRPRSKGSKISTIVFALGHKVRIDYLPERTDRSLEFVRNVFGKHPDPIFAIKDYSEVFKLLLDVLKSKSLTPLVIFTDRLHVSRGGLENQLLINCGARRDELSLISFNDRYKSFGGFKEVVSQLIV
jgi:hypothetical protein